MTSWLSEYELFKLFGKYPGEAFLYRGVSQTQFSIAKYYGGASVNGQRFSYIPETDELIRDDVRKEVLKWRKAEKKEREAASKAAQGELTP